MTSSFQAQNAIPRKVDVIIVGHGLAGATLAIELRRREKSVLVLDRGEESSASRVAAGLISPIAGRFLGLAWRVEELLPVATAFWQAAERELRAKFFTQKPLIRLFGREQAERWKKVGSSRARWVHEDSVRLMAELPKRWQAPFGGIVVAGAARLAVAEFLEVARRDLVARGAFWHGDFAAGDLEWCGDEEGHWRWHGVAAQRVVFCQGLDARQHSWFAAIPFRPAKGEILRGRFSDGSQGESDAILTRDSWVFHDGDEWCTGANYEFSDLSKIPSAKGRSEILEKLGRMTGESFEVTGQVAGVRPIIQQSKPVLGSVPNFPGIGFFNGLGSKGVLTAPFFARQLAAHLFDGTAIDPEVDVRSFL